MNTDETAQASSAPARKSRGSALAVVIGLFAVVAVVTTAFLFLVLEFALEIPSSPVPLIVIGVVPQLLVLVVGYLWMTRRLNRFPVSVPSTRQFGVVVAGIVGAFVVQLVLDVGRSVLGVGVAPTVLTRLGQQNTSVFLFALAVQLVLVGPAEEFLYRGALQGQLRTVFGPTVSIGLPAVLFGLFHIPNYVFAGASLMSAAMWYSLVVIAASGAVFGYLFEWTDNLVVPILSHALLNMVFITLTIATGV